MSASNTMRTASRILRITVTVFVFTVIAFLIWRAFFSANMPDSVTTLIPNEALSKAYEEKGDALLLQYQNLDNITRGQLTEKEELAQNRKSNYGYFAVTRVDIIPEADQIQIVFRYNNSTINALKDDYGLATLPDRSETLYDVSIVISTDLTPDDDSDNLDGGEESVKKTRIFPTESYTVSDEKNMYNYRKYVFENVSLDEFTLALFVDFYYVGDIDYDKTAYGTVCIWDYKTTTRTRALTSADKNAILAWRNEE